MSKLLRCETPESWFDAARRDLPTLLIDHANCEKKAAGTAVSLLYRYVDKPKLLRAMSRLAREELRHFEQVLTMLESFGIIYTSLTPSRYAAAMHSLICTSEPGRLVDTLIIGAVVEARSCERFGGLATRIGGRLGDFYHRLMESEARHAEQYLELAREYSALPNSDRRNQQGAGPDAESFEGRLERFVARDQLLVLSADSQFRFHSGLPTEQATG
jgi:tRNA-(ms[2]io[6]A)-hydroxylase